MTALPGWLRDILTMAESKFDVAAVLTAAGHALNAGEVTAEDLIEWGRLVPGCIPGETYQATDEEKS